MSGAANNSPTGPNQRPKANVEECEDRRQFDRLRLNQRRNKMNGRIEGDDIAYQHGTLHRSHQNGGGGVTKTDVLGLPEKPCGPRTRSDFTDELRETVRQVLRKQIELRCDLRTGQPADRDD